jgi:pimeloyl-ACP methyl ester carboxylesterase
MQNSALGLANSLRGMGAGQQRPLWASLPELDLPVSLIVGQNDSRYCAIAQRMHTLLPRGDVTVIAEAGHTAHMDQPGVFVKAVQCALSRN